MAARFWPQVLTEEKVQQLERTLRFADYGDGYARLNGAPPPPGHPDWRDPTLEPTSVIYFSNRIELPSTRELSQANPAPLIQALLLECMFIMTLYARNPVIPI